MPGLKHYFFSCIFCFLLRQYLLNKTCPVMHVSYIHTLKLMVVFVCFHYDSGDFLKIDGDIYLLLLFFFYKSDTDS